MKKLISNERPSALAAACAAATPMPRAHAYAVGQPVVSGPVAQLPGHVGYGIQTPGTGVGASGGSSQARSVGSLICASGFAGAPSKIRNLNRTVRTNYIKGTTDANGTTSVIGTGMATSLRSKKQRIDEVRGVPPRGRPV